MTTPLIHHVPIIAHLRKRMLELSEAYVHYKADAFRIELIWNEVAPIIRDIEIAVNAAIDVNQKLKHDYEHCVAVNQMNQKEIESLRLAIDEKNRLIETRHPSVIAAHNGVDWVKLTRVNSEHIELGYGMPSFFIEEYADGSGYSVSVNTRESDDDTYDELARWQYLHKPSAAELMARLSQQVTA